MWFKQKTSIRKNDQSFWECCYLPPGVHPTDLDAVVEDENEFYEDTHWNGQEVDRLWWDAWCLMWAAIGYARQAGISLDT